MAVSQLGDFPVHLAHRKLSHACVSQCKDDSGRKCRHSATTRGVAALGVRNLLAVFQAVPLQVDPVICRSCLDGFAFGFLGNGVVEVEDVSGSYYTSMSRLEQLIHP